MIKVLALLAAAALGLAGYSSAPRQRAPKPCRPHHCPTTSTTTTTSPTTTTIPTTATVPTTTTIPTTTTNPPPSGQLWSSDSPWNTPIPVGASIDPSSSAVIGALGPTIIQWVRYGVALYYANANTPRYDVLYSAAGKHLTVPIPNNAIPAGGSDAHLTVIDNDPTSPTYNCAFDFLHPGQVSGDGSGFDYSNPRAEYLQREKLTETGWIHGASTRGSSDTNMGGAMTSQEFAQGHIDHALGFYAGSARADNGQPYLPSYTSDGTNTSSTAIPEGARFRLNPNYDASALPQYQQIMATALKTYGAYVVDQGGEAFYAVDNTHSGIGPAYPWGSTQYPSIPASMMQNMQLLTLGARTTETYDPITNHPCGNFH